MAEMTQIDMFMQAHRKHDQLTSMMAAAKVAGRVRSQNLLLLVEYANANMTDEEAGIRTGLKAKGASYWRRCSDLRGLGLIEPTGEKRLSTMGELRMVCRITALGREVLEGVAG